MDSGFSDKLKTVLSDPEAMARISAIAGGLGAAKEGEAALPPPVPAERDPRVALLYSLKPLLREDKRGRIDDIAKAFAVISLMKNAKK